MLGHILFFAFLLAAAWLFALLEIHIEGEAGWATSLPTWRWQNRLSRWLLGAREITGYHLYAHLFVALLSHLPYALGFVQPTLAAELRILAFLALFWILEDFLWFVINPGFGLSGFRRDRVPWHADTWWGIMPRDYWIFIPVGIGLYALSWLI